VSARGRRPDRSRGGRKWVCSVKSNFCTRGLSPAVGAINSLKKYTPFSDVRRAGQEPYAQVPGSSTTSCEIRGAIRKVCVARLPSPARTSADGSASDRYRLRGREAVRDPSTSFALLTSLRMTLGEAPSRASRALILKRVLCGLESLAVLFFSPGSCSPAVRRQPRVEKFRNPKFIFSGN
jgi:hypothetical protein